MITCTRKIEFDAAHRIINHESKCKMLHGHRYVLEATFIANYQQKDLDDLGRVIDFGVIKQILGNWIDSNLDHNTILSLNDKKLGEEIEKITNQKIYYLEENPTAENIAKHIFQDICPELFKNLMVKCVKVKLYETPNCFSEIE
jgi:6-pyruvoyltetrahydropterin/6-carboxytetrahydropterin synthase